MSIVLTIMGLVLAGGMSLLNARVGTERLNLTQTRLDAAYEALIAYYIANNRLPCPADGSLPATDANYGRAQPEDGTACVTASVTATEQVIPWRTLGLQENQSLDAWERRFSYFVTAALTLPGSTQTGDIVVRDGAVATAGSAELTDQAAFLVISHGENGLGGWQRSGTRIATAGTATEEALNVDGVAPFIDRRINDVDGNIFDDLVRWREKSLITRATGAAFSGAICTAADDLWTAQGCIIGSTADACLVSEALRARCI